MDNNTLADITAKTLAGLRAGKNVTQEAVADALGVSNKTVSKWENGALPETEYLPALADYYGVTIGELLGRDEPRAETDEIVLAYKDLSPRDAAVKSFELAFRVIRGCIARYTELFSEYSSEFDDLALPAPVPPRLLDGEAANCTRVQTGLNYEIVFNHENANMAVLLLNNDANFRWITERAQDYLPVFKFLADPDAIKLTYLFHDQTFPNTFTADFLAERAGVSLNRTLELLAEAEKIEFCQKNFTAHLKDGTADIYAAYGDGVILSLLTLALEIVTPEYRDYAVNATGKMINAKGEA